MTNNEFIRIAHVIVNEAFEGQLDYQGLPMKDHMKRVAARVPPSDVIAYVVALLHDVIEDCHVKYTSIVCSLFPVEVINAVDILTHWVYITYEDYLEGIIRSKNPTAYAVKLFDLCDNLDPTRYVPGKEKTRLKHQNALLKMIHAAEKLLKEID